MAASQYRRALRGRQAALACMQGLSYLSSTVLLFRVLQAWEWRGDRDFQLRSKSYVESLRWQWRS